MNCFICDKKINDRDVKHIYYCAKVNKLRLSKDEIRYKYICYNAGVDFTKELLEYCYVDLEWSLPDFKREYKLAYKQTTFLLSYFSIKKRGVKEANASVSRLKKYRKTCKDRYGVDNVSKLEDVKEKKKETFFENYGVDNIWKSKDYYEWLHEYMKDEYGSKSLPNRFGNMQKYWDKKSTEEKRKHMKPANKAYVEYWNNLSDEQKNIIIRKRCRNLHLNPSFTSKLETRCSSILTKMSLSYVYQFWINRKSYDFRINKTNIIIEVQGDYWHANPKLYREDDIISYPEGFKKAKEIWKRDKKKENEARRYGYIVIYLWESDFLSCNDEELSKFIERKIKDEVMQNKIN